MQFAPTALRGHGHIPEYIGMPQLGFLSTDISLNLFTEAAHLAYIFCGVNESYTVCFANSVLINVSVSKASLAPVPT